MPVSFSTFLVFMWCTAAAPVALGYAFASPGVWLKDGAGMVAETAASLGCHIFGLSTAIILEQTSWAFIVSLAPWESRREAVVAMTIARLAILVPPLGYWFLGFCAVWAISVVFVLESAIASGFPPLESELLAAYAVRSMAGQMALAHSGETATKGEAKEIVQPISTEGEVELRPSEVALSAIGRGTLGGMSATSKWLLISILLSAVPFSIVLFWVFLSSLSSPGSSLGAIARFSQAGECKAAALPLTFVEGETVEQWVVGLTVLVSMALFVCMRMLWAGIPYWSGPCAAHVPSAWCSCQLGPPIWTGFALLFGAGGIAALQAAHETVILPVALSVACWHVLLAVPFVPAWRSGSAFLAGLLVCLAAGGTYAIAVGAAAARCSSFQGCVHLQRCLATASFLAAGLSLLAFRGLLEQVSWPRSLVLLVPISHTFVFSVCIAWAAFGSVVAPEALWVFVFIVSVACVSTSTATWYRHSFRLELDPFDSRGCARLQAEKGSEGSCVADFLGIRRYGVGAQLPVLAFLCRSRIGLSLVATAIGLFALTIGLTRPGQRELLEENIGMPPSVLPAALAFLWVALVGFGAAAYLVSLWAFSRQHALHLPTVVLNSFLGWSQRCCCMRASPGHLLASPWISSLMKLLFGVLAVTGWVLLYMWLSVTYPEFVVEGCLMAAVSFTVLWLGIDMVVRHNKFSSSTRMLVFSHSYFLPLPALSVNMESGEMEDASEVVMSLFLALWVIIAWGLVGAVWSTWAQAWVYVFFLAVGVALLVVACQDLRLAWGSRFSHAIGSVWALQGSRLIERAIERVRQAFPLEPSSNSVRSPIDEGQKRRPSPDLDWSTFPMQAATAAFMAFVVRDAEAMASDWIDSNARFVKTKLFRKKTSQHQRLALLKEHLGLFENSPKFSEAMLQDFRSHWMLEKLRQAEEQHSHISMLNGAGLQEARAKVLYPLGWTTTYSSWKPSMPRYCFHPSVGFVGGRRVVDCAQEGPEDWDSKHRAFTRGGTLQRALLSPPNGGQGAPPTASEHAVQGLTDSGMVRGCLRAGQDGRVRQGRLDDCWLLAALDALLAAACSKSKNPLREHWRGRVQELVKLLPANLAAATPAGETVFQQGQASGEPSPASCANQARPTVVLLERSEGESMPIEVHVPLQPLVPCIISEVPGAAETKASRQSTLDPVDKKQVSADSLASTLYIPDPDDEAIIAAAPKEPVLSHPEQMDCSNQWSLTSQLPFLLEAAVAKYFDEAEHRLGSNPWQPLLLAALVVGNIETGMEWLTGCPVNVLNIHGILQGEALELLRTTLAYGGLAVALTLSEDALRHPLLTASHAYAVTSVQEAEDGAVTVHLRNPHGAGGGRAPDFVTPVLSLQDFVGSFSKVCVASALQHIAPSPLASRPGVGGSSSWSAWSIRPNRAQPEAGGAACRQGLSWSRLIAYVSDQREKFPGRAVSFTLRTGFKVSAGSRVQPLPAKLEVLQRGHASCDWPPAILAMRVTLDKDQDQTDAANTASGMPFFQESPLASYGTDPICTRSSTMDFQVLPGKSYSITLWVISQNKIIGRDEEVCTGLRSGKLDDPGFERTIPRPILAAQWLDHGSRFDVSGTLLLEQPPGVALNVDFTPHHASD